MAKNALKKHVILWEIRLEKAYFFVIFWHFLPFLAATGGISVTANVSATHAIFRK